MNIEEIEKLVIKIPEWEFPKKLCHIKNMHPSRAPEYLININGEDFDAYDFIELKLPEQDNEFEGGILVISKEDYDEDNRFKRFHHRKYEKDYEKGWINFDSREKVKLEGLYIVTHFLCKEG